MNENFGEKMAAAAILGLVIKGQVALLKPTELPQNTQGVVISAAHPESLSGKVLDFAGRYVVNISGTTSSVLAMPLFLNIG